MVEVTLVIAFVAGLLSFLSPCVLPLIPAFISYLSGSSSKEQAASRKYTFMQSLVFVLGFSLIFAGVGVLINGVFSGISGTLSIWASRIGGAVIIVFGLYLLGLLKISFFEREHKIRVKRFKSNYVTSFTFGAAFAVGWTPCVGAILASILTLAAVLPLNAFALLVAYSLGLGIPFLIAGTFTSQFNKAIQKSQRAIRYVSYVSGIILIILGILVFTNSLTIIANLFPVEYFLGELVV